MPEASPSLLDSVRHALVVHAHPDDEALAGGALLRELHERGARVTLVTCTRGELGEIVAGVLPEDTPVAELAAVRERELRGSLDALGIDEHRWLGTAPARAAGLEPREYRDSGMRWLRPGLAGPADETDLRALSVAPVEEVIGDLAAVIAHDTPDLVISYDATGGYGHPDHVRAREASLAAARAECASRSLSSRASAASQPRSATSNGSSSSSTGRRSSRRSAATARSSRSTTTVQVLCTPAGSGRTCTSRSGCGKSSRRPDLTRGLEWQTISGVTL